MTDTATEPEHDTATCTDEVIMTLSITRRPQDDASPDDMATGVELNLHLHTRSEVEVTLETLRETTARLEAYMLLSHLQHSMPAALLAEMIEQLDIITGGEAE